MIKRIEEKENMKILHIWDVVGVATILAKYQRRLGHEAEVIMRDGLDAFKIHKFYSPKLFKGSALNFYRFAIKEAKKFDIVHINSLTKVVLFIRKPKVLHFHGSDIADPKFSGRIENYIATKLVDKVLLSTPDLLRFIPTAEWLPNPVDTDHFYSRQPKKDFTNKKLTFKFANYPHAYTLEGTNETIPYEDMPDYLLSKTHYVDTCAPALCKTSFEALACGIPVIWNGLKIQPPCPKEHEGLNVAKRTIEIYEELLKR